MRFVTLPSLPSFIYSFVAVVLNVTTHSTTIDLSSTPFESIACFNTIFEISCADSGDEILLFESAHYGRNDTRGANTCDVPYSQLCDLDVQHPLSQSCGGKKRCSIAINTAFFGDPCGYDEFLIVTYRCIRVDLIDTRCHHPVDKPSSTSSTSSEGPVRTVNLVDNGYISSPGYPFRYDRDTECQWTIMVQPSQTIRLILFDFELDVKTGGMCRELVEIIEQTMSQSRSVLFSDCGSVGQQIIDVQSSIAEIQFTTGQYSLAQRGFILYYEAVGPGCPLFPSIYHAVYYVTQDGGLYADVTCSNGASYVQCIGISWNQTASCLQTETFSTVNTILTSSVSMISDVPSGKIQVHPSSVTTTAHPPLLVVGLAVSASAAFVTFCISGCLFIICLRRRKPRPRSTVAVVVAEQGAPPDECVVMTTCRQPVYSPPAEDVDVHTSSSTSLLLTPARIHYSSPAEIHRAQHEMAADNLQHHRMAAVESSDDDDDGKEDDAMQVDRPDVVPDKQVTATGSLTTRCPMRRVTWLTTPEKVIKDSCIVERQEKRRPEYRQPKTSCTCRNGHLYHLAAVNAPNDFT